MSEKNSFEFRFFVEPKVKERPRFSNRGSHVYTPKKTKIFEDEIKLIARKYLFSRYNRYPWPIKIPVIADVTFYFKKPKKPKFDVPATKSDLDNYCKSLLDSLNKLVLQDDALIVKLIAEKKYTEDESFIDLILTEI